MEFEQDLLISYAHIDNQALMEGERGWVSEFQRTLEIRMAQLLGKKPKIWRDQKLKGNDFFSDEIHHQFPKIALLVSILSPRYVNSEWCLREVSEFQKVASQGIGQRLKNKSRIFKVIKTPVPRDNHPGETRNLLGYEFYSVDKETGKTREFGKIFGPESERAYWARLDDLAHDICDLLAEINALDAPDAPSDTNGHEAANAPAGEPAKPLRKAYLSQVSYDLQEERDSIRRELENAGFEVLPQAHLSMIAPELEKEVAEYLQACELVVQLVGANYGVVPEGSQQSIVEIQNKVLTAHASTPRLQRLVWIANHQEVTDERQRHFLESLREDPDQLAGADLFEANLEELKFAIHDALKQKEPEAVPKAELEAAEKGVPTVYLICDQQDLDAIIPLEDQLFDAGFEVTLPAFEGNENEVRTDHQENLRTCTAVLIYHGAGSDLWLRSQTRELMKSPGYGRKGSFQAKAVCLGAPDSSRKSRFRSHDLTVINALTGITDETLVPFIQQLKNALDQ
ncbi:MAG: DUF4062 domain-containing protein [Salibacteraceae bacterium]